MSDCVSVQCPYCGEYFEIFIESDLEGNMVSDCEVCCHPLALTVRQTLEGEISVDVDRAQ
jgi:hypothetical protein